MKKTYKGLSDIEVLESRKINGSNELKQKKKENLVQKILHIFSEPMFLLLIIAASIYFILGEITDGITMLVFVLFISAIEFIQEQKTDKAIEALNKLSSLNVKVIRNNKIISVDSKEIVVNDIVFIEEGDKIPADGIILECNALGVNESALTGESNTVYKNIEEDESNYFKKNMCYAGCDVTNGSAIIKIVEVGINTEYGKIGKSLNNIVKEKTPLEKQIKKLIVTCTIISLILFFAVIIINFFENNSMVLKDRIIQSILSGVTVAMATIPEEIPVILTVFLSMGAWNLAKKNTLTRDLKSVETLGAVTVLCTDKTGTITQNKMEIKETFSKDKEFLNILALSISKNPYDPMEIAIKNYCTLNNVDKNIYNHSLIYEYIFNNEDKMMGQIWNIKNKNLLCVKGAYENVINLCNIDKQSLEEINKKVEVYSESGYRVLAVAKKNDIENIPNTLKENELVFVGLIALLDPPREGIQESIKSCYDAGIKVIMITGDNGKTAMGIANQIGLKHNNNYITGNQLENMSEMELKEKVKDTTIFARVYPNHKMKIVNALQQNNEIVAMTGDGINDAPALKKAEIGIAMGKRGTNVAKESADMILMDDNFNTIVDSIKNGRTIYKNIQKAISYVLVIHMPIAFASLFIPLLKLPNLLLPIHIVLLELIIDPTSSIVFQRLKPDSHIMQEKPRGINDSIINKKNVIKCILQGFLMFIAFFGSYYYLIKTTRNYEYATTFAFAVLVFSNMFIVCVLQSNHMAITNFINNLKDKIIILINTLIVIALLGIIYIPFLREIVGTVSLKIIDLLWVIMISLIATIPFELTKIINKKN